MQYPIVKCYTHEKKTKEIYKKDHIQYTQAENCRDGGEIGETGNQIGLRAMLNEDKCK